jgi:signal peptidase I
MQENNFPVNEITPPIPAQSGKSPLGKFIKKGLFILAFIFVCMVIAYLLSQALFATVPIKGPSMEPTLYTYDRVLLYKLGNYRYGDVVVFKSELQDEDGEDRYLVKRIIGLPGDTVEIKLAPSGEYSVYLNGERLIEDYLDEAEPRAESSMDLITVPEGKFFYLGDHRTQSSDSRTGLLGDIEEIVGRAFLKYHGEDFFNELTPIPRIKA